MSKSLLNLIIYKATRLCQGVATLRLRDAICILKEDIKWQTKK